MFWNQHWFTVQHGALRWLTALEWGLRNVDIFCGMNRCRSKMATALPSLCLMILFQLTSSQSTYDVVQQDNDVSSCERTERAICHLETGVSQLATAMSQLTAAVAQLETANSQLLRDVAELKTGKPQKAVRGIDKRFRQLHLHRKKRIRDIIDIYASWRMTKILRNTVYRCRYFVFTLNEISSVVQRTLIFLSVFFKSGSTIGHAYRLKLYMSPCPTAWQEIFF